MLSRDITSTGGQDPALPRGPNAAFGLQILSAFAAMVLGPTPIRPRAQFNWIVKKEANVIHQFGVARHPPAAGPASAHWLRKSSGSEVRPAVIIEIAHPHDHGRTLAE